MIRRVIPIPVPCLMLVIIAILGVASSSASAQAQISGHSLVFSTYLGGSKECFPGGDPLTFAQNAACDAQGNTYVTGGTQVWDLPVLNAYQPGPAALSTMSAFVAKYNPVGTLLWCTYLGGNQQSMGVGVAAMPNGGVVVAGLTSSDVSGPFPTMKAFQGQNNGLSDYFVTVFNANGNLQYSTYLGGSGVEGTPGSVFTDNNNSGNNVAVDAAGLVYVTGTTSSGGGVGAIQFPVTPNALQSELGGDADAFLCIIDPSQSGADSRVYSSFHGGDKDDKGHSVAVDAQGRYITVAGYTKSSNFPTTNNAYRQLSPPAGFVSNGFVTQIASSQPGSPSSQYTKRYSTYLGANTSTARDDTYGIALNPQGLIVATGRTQSSAFPMTPPGTPSIFNSAPYLQAGVSGDEPYLVKIDPASTGAASLVYSTFLGGGSAAGGQWASFCTSVGVDSRGMVYVAGETNAPGQVYTPSGQPVEAPENFPYTRNARYPALQGNWDAIFMQINPGGATLGYSTYLGGTGNDRTYGLAVDSAGNVVLSGLTFSANFPLRNPAQTWPGNTGSQNAFVTKFSAGGASIGSLLLLLLDN